jgi:hypothetical protein
MGFLVFVFCLTLAPARPLADQTLQLAVSAIFWFEPQISKSQMQISNHHAQIIQMDGTES